MLVAVTTITMKWIPENCVSEFLMKVLVNKKSQLILITIKIKIKCSNDVAYQK